MIPLVKCPGTVTYLGGFGGAHYRRLAKLNSNYGAGCMLAVFTSCLCRHYICLNAADCSLLIFVFRQQRCAIWSTIVLGTIYWPLFSKNPSIFIAIAIGLISNF